MTAPSVSFMRLRWMVVAFIFLIVGMVTVTVQQSQQSAMQNAERQNGAAVANAQVHFPTPATAHVTKVVDGSVPLFGISEVDARAFALLGQIADGTIPALPELDAETMAAIDRMRPDIDEHRPRRGAGRTLRIGGGTVAIAPAPNLEQTLQVDGGDPLTEANGVDLVETIAVPGDVALAEGAHVISGKGTFAGITLKPGQGPVQIVDRSDGGSCIRLHGNDFGSVRVNGGIVVPGRCYQIDGSVTITAGSQVGIDIVPLIAVPGYQEQPWSVPQAPG
jgi:hypothetical protein